jgi:dihydropteridine reductase
VFRATSSWKIASIDSTSNEEADDNYLVDHSVPLGPQITDIRNQHLKNEYDTIICTAGGWAGGSIKDDQGLESFDKMHRACTLSALMTGHIASHHLAPKGLLVFTGSKSVYMGPAPGMIGYHVAKTATHAIAQNMAMREDIPNDSTVLTILPDVLDTPGNRSAMPDADHSKWADCFQVAALLKMWASKENLPKNGSFIALDVKNGSVSPNFL